MDMNPKIFTRMSTIPIILALFLLPLASFTISLTSAEVTELNVTPEVVVQGETLSISGKASPYEEVWINSSFELSLPVSEDGKYRREFFDIEFPQGEKSFAVTAENIKNIRVSLYPVFWQTIEYPSEGPLNATNGTATISISFPVTWDDITIDIYGKKDVKVYGDGADDAISVHLKVAMSIKVTADSYGDFTLGISTEGVPIGEFLITVGAIEKTIRIVAAPLISSSTHPDEDTWYCNRNPTFTWTTPSDASGIACYSYILDNFSSTIPDETCNTTENTKSYTDLEYGTWYFHVRAKNNTDNWGPADHYRVQIEDCDDKDGCYPYSNGCEARDYYCDGSFCVHTYSNRHTDYHDDWIYYCSGDTVRKHRLYHDFYCDGGSCTDHTSWVDDRLVENCNDYDRGYCNGDTREYRDYYCSGGGCTYTVTSSENCSDYDGWVDTGDTKWIDDPENVCKEKEHKEQEYRDYTCSSGSCTYSVTNTQWIDTGNVRNKPDGTICGCTANNTLKKCYNGTCSDMGICNSTYCDADSACDGKSPGEKCGTDSKCNSTCKCVTNQPPIASFTYSPENIVVNQMVTFDASSSYDLDGTIVNYEWNFGDGNITNTTEEVIRHSYYSTGNYDITLTVTDDGGAKNTTSRTIAVSEKLVFDTGFGTYPSIFGIHTGEITPNQTIAVSKLYTYPCIGTGGHSEYVKICNVTWNVTANWTGYTGDWHNITFSTPFFLLAKKTYNYTIITGSYPQIIHQHEANVTGGTITCTEFVDANGKIYIDWIPAILLR